MSAESLATIAAAREIIGSGNVDARRALHVMLWLMPYEKRNRIIVQSDWHDFMAEMFTNDHDFARNFFVEADVVNGIANLPEPQSPWKQVLEIAEMIHQM